MSRAGRGASASGPAPRAAKAPRDDVAQGTIYGFAAYGIWGVFPLYFHTLFPAGPFEIFAHRIVWTMVFCLVVLAVRRDLGFLRDLARRPRLVGGIALAALFIGVNWLVYVAAVAAGNVQEAALGYFLNPLVTVALGVVILGERLRVLQWVAVGIGVIAGGYLTLVYGRVPWSAAALAVSFALYGLTKKKLGASLAAMHGLVAETAALTPIAIIVLAVVGTHQGMAFGHHGAGHTMLMLTSGIVTAIPLLFFAAAASRVPLVTIGMIQFITPIMQLSIGVLVLGEHMSQARWIGFALVWCALLVLTYDSLQARGRSRRAARLEAAEINSVGVVEPPTEPRDEPRRD